MAIELKVPPAGESITEVQIGEWLKKEGDSVRRDEIIVVIETDKVTVELPAPADGVISKILIGNGKDAVVGDVVGLMEEGVVEGAPAKTEKKSEKKADKKAAAPAAAAPAPAPAKAAPAEEEEHDADVRKSLPPEAFARVMPAARRVVEQNGVDVADVRPTGPGGRVLKEDVERHLERAPAVAKAQQPVAPRVSDERGEEVVAMSPMRKKIAERLVQSQQTMALLTTFNEVDMSAVMELRKQYQDSFTKKYGIKLGFMSFFVKAAIEGLKEFPAVNSEIHDKSIVYKNYYDIGVAVGGGKGLVVPVIRNADRLGFAEVEQAIAEYGVRAKANQIKLEELQGGTFTISNGGIYGSMLSTPIVNPPQSGILGLHNIVERPVAVAGKVEIRPIMYLALTYDHRIVDGREAVSFLKRVKECIESPSRILLEI
ncbi:MAG TPA: 2-oxoglutarate dehydrogenase complex dihydrolipoyllysine-residue succinyltransferase [Polyangiaceae bacterium]|nr:2-oxoglutarate dehydrogenase complex dihydrolipoyllysine-residue succinyltransferase [Polyangiaceae bacterium]